MGIIKIQICANINYTRDVICSKNNFMRKIKWKEILKILLWYYKKDLLLLQLERHKRFLKAFYFELEGIEITFF